MWIPHMEALSDEFRVIAVDLPGHATLREQPFQRASAVQLIVESLGQETNSRAACRALAWGIGGDGNCLCSSAADRWVGVVWMLYRLLWHH
jgi:hypothetical protein